MRGQTNAHSGVFEGRHAQAESENEPAAMAAAADAPAAGSPGCQTRRWSCWCRTGHAELGDARRQVAGARLKRLYPTAAQRLANHDNCIGFTSMDNIAEGLVWDTPQPLHSDHAPVGPWPLARITRGR